MRISDWSSDVCSSDLKLLALDRFIARKLLKRVAAPKTETMTPRHGVELLEEDGRAPPLRTPNKASIGTRDAKRINELFANRSEERRVGKECVSACRYRWSPYQ